MMFWNLHVCIYVGRGKRNVKDFVLRNTGPGQDEW